MTQEQSTIPHQAEQNYPKAALFFLLTMVIFAGQDGITKYMASQYNAVSIVMIRYWAFAAFVIFLVSRKKGIRETAKSAVPWVQLFRGVLLGFQVIVMAFLFAGLGLLNTHVVFASYPVLVTLFSIPILGEKVGWARSLAVLTGLLGVMIILKPTSQVFDPLMLLPLFSAALFALYNILTRYVSRTDSGDTSFFWTGIGGLLISSAVGPFFWDMPQGNDWVWMIILCITGATGHYLMIRALELGEASSLQPFSYLQLLFASLIGVIVFGENIDLSIILGGMIIVSAGLFTIWRERLKSKV